MTRALIIRLNGQFVDVQYDNIDDFTYEINNFNEYRIVEIHENNNDNEYLIYATDVGSNYNSFDLHSINATNDIVVTERNMHGFPIDINISDFMRYYTYTETLDNTIIDDEFDFHAGHYDYDDDFTIDDNDDNDQEMQDFNSYIEYGNEHY